MTSTRRKSRPRRNPILLALALTVVALVGITPALSSLGVFSDSATGPVATATALSPYSRAVLTDSPMVYYPLDERSGTVARDIAAGQRHATYTGAVSPGGRSIPQNAGGSAVFTGGSIPLSGLPVPTAPRAKVTIDFWMHLPATSTGFEIPLSLGYNNLYAYQGRFGFNTGNGDLLGISSTGLFGRPVHVALVIGNATSTTDYAVNRKMYIDGVAQTLTQSGAPLIHPLSSTGRISGISSGDPLHVLTNGARISDVAIYDGELDATQVDNHYKAGLSYANLVLSSNPVAYWKFDESNGVPTITDYTQQGLNGTYPAGSRPGQAGLVRDGKTSVNWNRAVPAQFSVPLSGAPGAVTTVEFWMDAAATQPNEIPIALGHYALYTWGTTGCGGSYAFGVDPVNGIGGTSLYGVPWSSIGAGRHHVVVSLTNNNQAASRMWIDGTERALSLLCGPLSTNTTVTQIPSGNTGNVTVGGYQGSFGWSTRLDEVAIYNGSLSNDTIMAHYRTGR